MVKRNKQGTKTGTNAPTDKRSSSTGVKDSNPAKFGEDYTRKVVKKSGDRRERKEPDMYKKPGGNDPAWWNKYPELVDLAANLTWNVSIGSKTTFDPVTDTGALKLKAWDTGVTPGILAVDFLPIPGVGDQISDPVNKVFLQMYQTYRKDKSGTTPFNFADVGKVIIAVDSLYTMIGYASRLYGVLNVASRVNRYIPRDLYTAMNADFDDFDTNKANFSFWLNSFITRASVISVPSNISMFKRHYALASELYLDEDLSSASVLLFNPGAVWLYDDTRMKLTTKPFATQAKSVFTFATLRTFMEDALNRIISSEDFQIMNAYATNAYSASGLMALNYIPADYAVLPSYHPEIVVQLHNATFLGSTLFLDVNEITENVKEGDPNLGALEITISTLFESGEVVGPLFNQIVDIPWEVASKDDIMEATRLKCMVNATKPSDTSTELTVATAGTEVLGSACLYTYDSVHDSTTDTWNWGLCKIHYYDLTNYETSLVTPADPAREITKINLYPLTYVLDKYAGNKWYIKGVAGDITKFALIDFNQLKNMHEAALYSALAFEGLNIIK